MAQVGLDKFRLLLGRKQQLQWFSLPDVGRKQGFLPLLLSTALAEVSGNIVYVVLLERAYWLGGHAASVGGVMLVQSIAQTLLGAWAGSLVDRFGKRKAAILATLINTALLAGLLVAHTLLALYAVALLIMLARLLLIPARLALVPHVSSKANLVTANTALVLVTGLGLFLGPAISATLMARPGGFQITLLMAGLGFALSVPPLLSVPAPPTANHPDERVSIWQEMRIGWQFVRRNNPVKRMLSCLLHYTLIMGAMMPLITPLAHRLGLGAEGTGIFFAAVGFGGLIGAPVAVLLAKRLSPSTILLLTGLLVPVGALFIGLIDILASALVAIMLIHLAGASLNVIVVTVLQRLTPLRMQGYVFGVQQALLGIAWMVSLALITGGMAIWPEEVNVQALFLLIGGAGFLVILTCWVWYRHHIQAACEMCKPRLRMLAAVCQMICASVSQASGIACRMICDGPSRCGLGGPVAQYHTAFSLQLEATDHDL